MMRIDANHRTMAARPIRVAHIALQLDTGGMERLLVDHARHVDRERASLHFIALGARGRVADEIEACGWPVTSLGASPGLRPSMVYRLAQLFRSENIDIVHTHNTKPLLYAGPAARLAGVGGVVHTRHGQRHGATRRQNALFALAARCADRMVCVSQDSAWLCQRDGIEVGKITTICNGIDAARFAFSGPARDGPALFVGRLSPEKDLPTLLRAAAIVARQRPRFRLQIAGAGVLRDELVALSSSLGLKDRVEFVGEVSDVPSLLKGASMFVLSSLTEGVPLTILEAMASGLPVVATSVGGTAEAVDHASTGLLVPPAQPERLAAAMLQVLSDPAAAVRMAEAGRARVTDMFDVRTMVSRYQSLYAEVLDRRMALAA